MRGRQNTGNQENVCHASKGGPPKKQKAGEKEAAMTKAAMTEQFSRTRRMLGDEAMDILAGSRVAVFGAGGVGGYVLEALARSGVGAIDVIDNDRICESNLNRQILATYDTIGRDKTEVAAERIRSINPACRVEVKTCFYLPETEEQFDFSAYDYVVDAVDTVTAKISLVMKCREAGTPIISCMGTGNKMNPAMLQVADIYKTSVDPLARVMRRELKKRGVKKLKVVYSTEEPLKPLPDPEQAESARRSIPASVAFVPSVAGLLIASEVIKDLIGKS
jgi:tRNA A37 threonylcarbamoyladenosine dehydratase